MAMAACTSVRALQLKLNNLSPFVPVNGKIFPNGLVRTGCRRHSMFLKAVPVVQNGVLSFNGTEALVGVPDNVVITPGSDSSAFLGAISTQSSSRHVFKLGVIEDARLLSLFRFKIWWMIPRVGNSGRDIPVETQMLLLEAREEPTSEEPNQDAKYVLFLPILDGEFRSSLQGNSADELEVCVETGDSTIIASASPKAVFVNFGDNPFELIKESMKILQKYSGTFALRETKQANAWNARLVWLVHLGCLLPRRQSSRNQRRPEKSFSHSLSEGGTPARFLIIDDGWQDTTNEFQKVGEPFIEGTQFGARLMSIKENSKFRKTANDDSSNTPHSLKDFVSDIKSTFGLKYVYAWHALMGYWGGLHPDAPGTKKYNPKLKFPLQSPGNLAHQRDIAMDSMEEYGVGTIDPDRLFEFYDDLHRYLASQEVDGVKVDVQNLPETVATGSGGRVSLTRHFQQSLEKSISNNFQDNGIICCMAQNTDSVYNSKTSSITRASDDYYPKNPTTQTLHIAAVAYNSLFFGEIVVPDWDMFYSLHDAAEFHAVARAVGGCGIYVRLVLPDGSVMRAKYPGRPSRDCLFNDPVTDGKSLMKIWNLNKLTGVLAVFNCQGAGTWPGLENSVQTNSLELAGKISPADIEYLSEISPNPGMENLQSFPSNQVYHQEIQFAPIGLINMYNSGGAVHAVEAIDDSLFPGIRIQGRGEGVFGAYSSSEPKHCSVNTTEAQFHFNSEHHFLTVDIPTGTNSWEIAAHY
ncbi:putative galactinol--sucrose galactosyltransferase 2 [Sesamum angolense]|uniref:galactinol--sucrose galactosyltransferase n=1 Tax=Sesamum angolense TaxID=2727404 RepID=A0AAE1W4Z2_9LAMI|nr:putative galactinol--sucrose galactosyltransferase 2 [Sesamum angolense]